jgi:chromosome partitioning protein
MTKIYAIVNQKGGVGKTTSVINLGAFLADSGRRTLIVDIDPQANATSGLGINKNELPHSVYDLLLEEAPFAEVVYDHDLPNLHMLPSNPSLSGAEVELVNAIGREYRLQKGSGADKRHGFDPTITFSSTARPAWGCSRSTP